MVAAACNIESPLLHLPSCCASVPAQHCCLECTNVQAQTVANFYLAFELDLAIVPVLNKIDMDSAEPQVRCLHRKVLFLEVCAQG
jgi:hypothetical protein